MIAISVPQQEELSPFDEYVYIDYLAKVPTQLAVPHGDPTGEYARSQLDCRGVVVLQPESPACDTGRTQPATAYPLTGKTSADIYTPIYFAVTWAAAQPLVWTGVDLTDAGRIVGGLWLGLGVVLMFLLMTRLRVPPLLAWGLSVLVIASPAVHWANGYVSTDAPTLAVGAGLGLLAALVYTRKASMLWLVVASVVGVLIKFQNIIAVCLVVIVFVVLAVRDTLERRPGGWRQGLRMLVTDRLVIGAAVALGSVLVAQVVWMLARTAMTVGTTPRQGVDTPVSLTNLLRESYNFLTKTAIAWDGAPPAPVEMFIGTVLVVLGIAGVVGMIFFGKPRSTRSLVALSVLVAATLSAPVLGLVLAVVVGEYVPLPPRYGMSLLPFFILCAGWLLAQRTWTSGVVAVGASALLVASMLHA